MKKIALILLLFFFLNSFSGKAQQYVPLVVDSAHWIVESCDVVALPPVGSAWEYYILGDTIVNSIQYKKVYQRGWDYQYCSISYQTIYPYQLFSLIREDTLTRKVYSTGGALFGCTPGNDTLMYDFDLQIGDTVNSCLFLNEKRIDTIIQNNIWLPSRTYKISFSADELYEGVGSNFGLFEIIEVNLSGGAGTGLAHYCRGGLSNCSLPLSVKETTSIQPQLHVYPNPTSSVLHIELPFSTDILKAQLHLFDITGKEVLTKEISSRSSQIDVSSYSKGIYFYRLENDIEYYSGKLVVQ